MSSIQFELRDQTGKNVIGKFIQNSGSVKNYVDVDGKRFRYVSEKSWYEEIINPSNLDDDDVPW